MMLGLFLLLLLPCKIIIPRLAGSGWSEEVRKRKGERGKTFHPWKQKCGKTQIRKIWRIHPYLENVSYLHRIFCISMQNSNTMHDNKNSIRTNKKQLQVSLIGSPFNKNRLCSKTCGIDNISTYCDRKEPIKSLQHMYSEFSPWQMPLYRYVQYKWERSHPEEKSVGVTDPTPKRNLVKEWHISINLDGSHPEENFSWEDSWTTETNIFFKPMVSKLLPPTTPPPPTTTLTVLGPDGFAAGKNVAFYQGWTKVTLKCFYSLWLTVLLSIHYTVLCSYMWCNQTCKEYAARILTLLLIWIQGGRKPLNTCFGTQEDTTHTKMDQQHQALLLCIVLEKMYNVSLYCKKKKETQYCNGLYREISNLPEKQWIFSHTWTEHWPRLCSVKN